MGRWKRADTLSLDELNTRIAAAQWSFKNAGNAATRKLYFKSLRELESQRETLHGIPAPDRLLSGRQK